MVPAVIVISAALAAGNRGLAIAEALLTVIAGILTAAYTIALARGRA